MPDVSVDELVRLQFLEEAQDYLQVIETGLLELGDIPEQERRSRLDGILRAAHSIKGGAAMMGFQNLSQLAHRMEDFFKVLRGGRPVDAFVQQELLRAVDQLQQVITLTRQGTEPKPSWLSSQADPIFNHLQEILGDPQAEDEMALLSEDGGNDMRVMLFESEVEACLQRLEAVIADPAQPCLREELEIAAQELEGLGQILELPAFTSFCASVNDYLKSNPTPLGTLAAQVLQQWRRSQALVLIGQLTALPDHFDPTAMPVMPLESSTTVTADALFIDEVDQVDARDEDEFSVIQLEDSTVPQLGEGTVTGDRPEPALGNSFDGESFADFELEQINLEGLADVLGGEFPLEVPPLGEDSGSLAAMNDELVEGEPVDNETAEDETDDDDIETILGVDSFPSQTTQKETTDQQTLSQPATPSPGAIAPEIQDMTVRVAVQQLDHLSDLFGELTIERNGLDLQLERLHQLLEMLKGKVRALEQSNFRLRTGYDRFGSGVKVVGNAVESLSTVPGRSPTPLTPSLPGGDWHQGFDSLEFDRYSDLHLLSQEVMESIVQIQEITSDLEIGLEDTEHTSRDLNRTAKQLQTRFTQIRMRPFADLANRYPRLIRHLCQEHGKRVKLDIQGGHTLIDRSVLAILSDPLMHIVRNAFDHGLESPSDRQRQGKSPQGHIELRATYRGNQTVITITDDGRGIDPEKLRQKALQLGFHSQTLNSARDRELIDLIFEPGFSTASQVTSLSGRGVGMDVVRTNLRQVRGDVRVETRLGEGTTFTITVPYTLSVVRVLLAEVAGMLVAIPTEAIEEMMLRDRYPIIETVGQKILDWQGYMIPLVQLQDYFRFSRPHRSLDMDAIPTINDPTVMLLAQGDDLIGIEIDRYWGEQEVTIRQVDGDMGLPPGFSGCTILGDGRIVPLIDTLALLRWFDHASLGDGAPARPPAPTLNLPQQETILVVDDSINVRRFLANTLEKAGYHVEQAKDGQEALDKLQTDLRVDAVICDIEMPRLDGYGFLAHVKTLGHRQQLPITMLTSRTGDKHRQLAFNLGAAAYFSKPFRETELLKSLRQLINGETLHGH
ncbi:response regulator [Candidatus Synechococcus calcipolaris G9]|uniref:histidine kinase n=1 Tax=Candidatus Synechococcus calcipolaris G9 TaxID=1497997 RepID=A0ABT6F266_9SYNE|nr:response regulator [Candidatus Synechococcus calcipolaris]MDG2991873.1 response regulator [Candidatus Synechococcus calcipolaris G9]